MKLSTACLTGSVETASECDNSDPTAEVLMVNGPRSPPGFPRNDGGDGGDDLSHVHEKYHPEPLSSQRREELRRHNMDALRTPIVGETLEARALKEALLANLSERTGLENLQHALDERARQRIPESSRAFFASNLGIPNSDSKSHSCSPNSRVNSVFLVRSWQRFDADPGLAPSG